ncbi:uncharacterized protein LOC131286271 [Anopheles ziemanni]|uniref:uncharacterized protein LOC131272435 n=1 Tax=Anopheles coustani TaxID=139045 RepID=UPI00265952B6|nr:uncharacterized protein LOC131272435 [Anopheles coustani]XP_058171186.1 uncharacterized protein LOC131286271 [Anopheles ziemanni]
MNDTTAEQTTTASAQPTKTEPHMASGASISVEAINTMRINPPDMNIEDLQSYFWALEHWFAASGITETMDARRYHIVLAQLPARSRPDLRPLLDAAPAGNKYEFAKRTIIAHYEESQRSRLQRLLSDMVLGDRKPSQLLAEMRRTANGAMSDSMLLDLWIGRLPPHIQCAVIATPAAAAEKARVADAVMDSYALHHRTGPYQSIAEVTSSTVELLSRQVAELTKRLDGMAVQQRRAEPRHRQRSHSRSSNRSKTSGFCYYHQRFGHAAKKCQDPCMFESQQQQERNNNASTSS